MILIDLLPPEHRQKRRTPIKFMAAVAASVAINCSLIAWWGWTAFGVAAEVKSELSVLRDTSQGLNGQVAYHRSLEAETNLFEAREEMLAKVTSSRVSWTRKMDELIDIVNAGGDGEKYLVWLDDVQVKTTEDARRETFGELKAQGHSGSDKFAHVANFLEDLENSPFISDFFPPGKPEGSEQARDEDLVPSSVWSFPLKLDLKSPEARKAAAAALMVRLAASEASQ